MTTAAKVGFVEPSGGFGGGGGGGGGEAGGGLVASAVVRVVTCAWVMVRSGLRVVMRSRSAGILSAGRDGGTGKLFPSSLVRATSSGPAGSGRVRPWRSSSNGTGFECQRRRRLTGSRLKGGTKRGSGEWGFPGKYLPRWGDGWLTLKPQRWLRQSGRKRLLMLSRLPLDKSTSGMQSASTWGQAVFLFGWPGEGPPRNCL